jgi:SAM-dependent methyltransferase
MQELYVLLTQATGIILATPVYNGGVRLSKIMALPGGEMYCLWTGYNLSVVGRLWNGSAWGAEEVCTDSGTARFFSPHSEFVVGTGETIPFSDNSFDAVASLLAFSYMRNPQKMLEETFRVLKPGGTFAVCTLGKNLLTRGIPAIYFISERFQVDHVVMRDFGEHYYNEAEMAHMFTTAGFTDVQTKWCSFAHIDLIDPLFHLARKVEPFVESRLPQLAYNICVSGTKPA